MTHRDAFLARGRVDDLFTALGEDADDHAVASR
jgi:hypothetical protein